MTRIAALALLIVLAAASAGRTETWRTYVNDRFGATVDYPPALFSVLAEPPANSDGQRFSTADNRATLAVYGSFNTEGNTFRTLMDEARDAGVSYSYADARRDSYVLSGTRGGRITYRRCIRSRAAADVVNCMDIEYPAAEARRWDAIVTRISGSLRSGRPYR